MCSLKTFIYLIFIGPSGGNRVCTIYSPSVTTNGEMMDIFIGTQNVILYCICMRMTNVAAGPTLWFINGTIVTCDSSDGDNPYSRNNVPAPLIIPSFTSTSAGTYGCRENTNTPPRVTINLVAISGMCNYIYYHTLYVCINMALLNQAGTVQRPARVWFLEFVFVQTSVCVCTCLCVSTPQAIKNYSRERKAE